MAFFNISFFKSKLAIFAAKRAQERKDRFIKSIFFFHLNRNTSTFTRPGDWYWTHAVKGGIKVNLSKSQPDFLHFEQKSGHWPKMGTFCNLTKNPDFDKKWGLFAFWPKIRTLTKNRDCSYFQLWMHIDLKSALFAFW